MKHALRAVTLLAALLPATTLANYPDRPIRLMLPFPPGGPSDIVGRMFAQELGKSLGQQVVIDNRGGAAGNIACEIAKNAAPDGYTLLQGTVGTMSINPHLYKNLPYEPLRDFAPISLLTETPYLLVINPKVPANNVKELVALAKSQPGKLNFASGGVGTGNHFSGELFKSLAGIDIVHIPYKGSGVGQNDVLAGQVQMMFINLLPALPFVQQGRLRGLGVTSARRSQVLPEVATVAEQGYFGFEASGWLGIALPAKTPAPIVQRLYRETQTVMALPDTKVFLDKAGLDLVMKNPEEFGAYIKAELSRWTRLIQEAGIKAD